MKDTYNGIFDTTEYVECWDAKHMREMLDFYKHWSDIQYKFSVFDKDMNVVKEINWRIEFEKELKRL